MRSWRVLAAQGDFAEGAAKAEAGEAEAEEGAAKAEASVA